MAPPPNNPPDPAADAAIRSYELFCLIALLVLLLVLIQRGHGPLWSAVPFLIGLAGVVGRRLMAVPVLVLALAFVLLDFGHFVSGGLAAADSLSDFLLCSAVLAYAGSQARLQGLAGPMVPVGSGPSGRTLLEGEVVTLIVAIPFWTGLAPLVWDALPDDWYTFGLLPWAWRLMMVVWLLGLVLVLGGTARLLLTWEQRGRTADEAVMYLQEVFWTETRGEQRRLHRWLTWARLRHERRKERS